MVFWDIAGKVAKTGVKLAQKGFETLQENMEKSNEYSAKYQYLSEEELREKYKRARSTAERMGIAKVLKDNGWLKSQE